MDREELENLQLKRLKWQVRRCYEGSDFYRERFLDKFMLSGKVVLVTGGSRGIGQTIALELTEAGADIVLASRKLPDLEAVAHEIS